MRTTPRFSSILQVLIAAAVIGVGFLSGRLLRTPERTSVEPGEAHAAESPGRLAHSGRSAAGGPGARLKESRKAEFLAAQKLSTAHRRIVLEEWLSTDPAGLLAFLKSLPPLAMPDLTTWINTALHRMATGDPVAAYREALKIDEEISGIEFPGAVPRYASSLLIGIFKQNPEAGYHVLEQCGYGEILDVDYEKELDWMNEDPGRVCRRLASVRDSKTSLTLLGIAARKWTLKDPAGALAALETAPRNLVEALLPQIARTLPPAEAVALLSNNGHSVRLLGALSDALARVPAPDAATLLRTLPPRSIETVTRNLASSVASSPDQNVLAQFAAGLPLLAWKKLSDFPGTIDGIDTPWGRLATKSDIHLRRLLPSAPSWSVPGLAESTLLTPTDIMPGTSGSEWFTALPESRALEVAHAAGRATVLNGQSSELKTIANLPSAQALQASLGAVSGMAERSRGSRPPSDEELNSLNAIPPEHAAAALTQLETTPAEPKAMESMRAILQGLARSAPARTQTE